MRDSALKNLIISKNNKEIFKKKYLKRNSERIQLKKEVLTTIKFNQIKQKTENIYLFVTYIEVSFGG